MGQKANVLYHRYSSAATINNPSTATEEWDDDNFEVTIIENMEVERQELKNRIRRLETLLKAETILKAKYQRSTTLFENSNTEYKNKLRENENLIVFLRAELGRLSIENDGKSAEIESLNSKLEKAQSDRSEMYRKVSTFRKLTKMYGESKS